MILDEFIGAVTKKDQRVNIFLRVGTRLNGFIGKHDEECIALHNNPKGNGSPTMVMRRAISSITEDDES